MGNILDEKKQIMSLYHIGKRLLEVRSREELAKVVTEEVSQLFQANTIVQFYDSLGNILYRNVEGMDVFSEEAEIISSLEAYLFKSVFSSRK